MNIAFKQNQNDAFDTLPHSQASVVALDFFPTSSICVLLTGRQVAAKKEPTDFA